MAAPRRIIDIPFDRDDLTELESLARSRTAPASWVERARILLAYRATPSTYAVAAALGVTPHTVQRCLERARHLGVMAALDDSPRPGKAPQITDAAKACVVSLACQKASETTAIRMNFWTTRLLAQHIRAHAEAAGYPCLTRQAQGTVSKILTRHAVKPHKVRTYLERRDEAFDAKMADVLCVYREVAILRESDTTAPNIAIISCDEKPGLQAIGNAAPDLPPQPGLHATFARDHDDKRNDTLGLIAGIDLFTGVVHACVEDRHRSCEFIGFLKQLDEAYPTDTAIKLILDNHSSHVSKETKAWLATRPEGRFTLVFTPKHGSWPNLIEGFFSKMARSMLRHIRVTSEAELKARILAYLEDINREPVIHTWAYRINEAA